MFLPTPPHCLHAQAERLAFSCGVAVLGDTRQNACTATHAHAWAGDARHAHSPPHLPTNMTLPIPPVAYLPMPPSAAFLTPVAACRWLPTLSPTCFAGAPSPRRAACSTCVLPPRYLLTTPRYLSSYACRCAKSHFHSHRMYTMLLTPCVTRMPRAAFCVPPHSMLANAFHARQRRGGL